MTEPVARADRVPAERLRGCLGSLAGQAAFAKRAGRPVTRRRRR